VGTCRWVMRRVGDCVRSPFFSEAVDLFNSVDDYTKGYHV
jgi:hypothetical protein